MPELPEVEVVRGGLQDQAVGRRIASVDVFSDRAVRRHPGGAADFRAIVAGQRITAVRRRGKYLWFALDGGDAIIAHLGMSGQFRVGGEQRKHLRVRFRFDDDRPDLDFVDQRTFGGMAFSRGGAELPAEIAHIGLDPLDPAFDLDLAVERVRRRDTEIKRALLDQTLVSGIGNIYADEALWLARLHFRRPTLRMPRPVIRRVLQAASEVMSAALRAGGTSFDALYVNVNGESGYFDRTLHAYGREGLPCDRCGAPIRREPFMNRSSFRCPVCQRPPRS